MSKRKIIQCWAHVNGDHDGTQSTTYYLCDDGTIWWWSWDDKRWMLNADMSKPPRLEGEDED